MIDELLQIDPALGIFGGVDTDVSVGADREVALAPAVDFVELGRIGNRPGVAVTPRACYTTRRTHSRK